MGWWDTKAGHWARTGVIVSAVIGICAIIIAHNDSGSISVSGGSQPTNVATSVATHADTVSPATNAVVAPTAEATPAASNTTLAPPTVVPTTTSPPQSYELSLGEVCYMQGASAYICGTDEGHSAEVGDSLFEYYGQSNGFSNTTPPNFDLIVSVPHNTCSHIKIDFAVRNRPSSGPHVIADARIVQANADPVEATTPMGTIGVLEADLNGGPFKLEANSTDASQVLANGTATCSTRSGQ